jgi:DNA polymerase-3 subunit delta'
MSRETDETILPDQLAGTPHPRTRDVLVGHAAAEAAFLEAFASGRLPPAWLIGGPHGIGKATLAYRVARRLLALGPGRIESVTGLAVDPAHPVARQVAAGAHPGLAVLRRTMSEDGRRLLTEIPARATRRAVELFGSTSVDGSFRVVIVDSAEDFNAQSANALLKVIEEPPERAMFLIVANAPERVLPTIRSRCRRLTLRPLSETEVGTVIDSLGPPFADAPADVRAAAVSLGDGSVRRTLELLDAETIALVDRVKGLLDTLPRPDPKGVLALAEMFGRRGGEEEFALVLDTAERWVGERLRRGAGEGPGRLAPLVEVCDKVARSAREIDIYNLDRRPLVLALFDDLAAAVRRTG